MIYFRPDDDVENQSDQELLNNQSQDDTVNQNTRKTKIKTARYKTNKVVTAKTIKKKGKPKKKIKVTLPNASDKDDNKDSRPGTQQSDNNPNAIEEKTKDGEGNDRNTDDGIENSDADVTETMTKTSTFNTSGYTNQQETEKHNDFKQNQVENTNDNKNTESEQVQDNGSDKDEENNSAVETDGNRNKSNREVIEATYEDNAQNKAYAKKSKKDIVSKDNNPKEAESKTNNETKTDKSKKIQVMNRSNINKKEQNKDPKDSYQKQKTKSTNKNNDKGGKSESKLNPNDSKQSEKQLKHKPRPKTADVGTQCEPADPADKENNGDEDCILFHEALFGRKIDKDSINNLLSTRTMEQRLNMVQAYKKRYDKDAVQDMRSEFKGDYKDVCVALLQDQATQDAELLNYSVKGLGTNEAALIHVLSSRSPKELNNIKLRYLELYGHEADADVKGDTSGSFQTLCLVQLNKGEGDTKQTDEHVAEEDARRIWRPGERPTQDNEDVLIEILTSFDKEQVSSVCHIYQKITEITFTDAIKRSTKGDFQDALLAMASFLEDSVTYHAELIYKSLKGFRSNDRAVINILVSQKEAELSEISEAFYKKYNKTLYQAVKSNYSGDFSRLLLQIIENHVPRL